MEIQDIFKIDFKDSDGNPLEILDFGNLIKILNFFFFAKIKTKNIVLAGTLKFT